MGTAYKIGNSATVSSNSQILRVGRGMSEGLTMAKCCVYYG